MSNGSQAPSPAKADGSLNGSDAAAAATADAWRKRRLVSGRIGKRNPERAGPSCERPPSGGARHRHRREAAACTRCAPGGNPQERRVTQADDVQSGCLFAYAAS